MNKAFIVGAGVTLAGLLIAPTFVGNSVESQTRSAIEKIDDHPLYSASVLSYDKGWFSSTATIELSLEIDTLLAAQQIDPAEQDTPDKPVVIAKVNAFHGPVYFGDGVGIAKVKYNASVDGNMLREYVTWQENQPFYYNEGKVGLFNGLSYTDTIPALKALENDGDIEFVFSGFNGEASDEGGATRYIGSSKSVEISGAGFSLGMLNTTVDMTYHGDFMAAISGKLFESDAALTAEQIEFSDSTDTNVIIDTLRMITSTDIDEQANTADIYLEYAVDDIKGAAQEASDIAIGIAVNNLDIDFIEAYQEFSNASLMVPSEDLPEKLQVFIKDNLLQQLQTEPEINIKKLAMTLPEGSIKGTANSKLTGITSLPDTMEDVAYWVSHLLMDAQISADKAFVESMASGYMVAELAANPQTQGMTADELKSAAEQQVPMVLDSFVQQGLLKETEQGFETSFALKDGTATINGTEVPLPFAQ